MSMGRPSIFMSHSHVDKPFARRLSADLGALGAHVWLDEAELKVGDSLFEKIEGALDQVDHLAVIMSPYSVASRWVREELRQALHSRLSGRNIVILPILLKDCEIPGFLREKLYADFREETAYEGALQRLAESLSLSMQNPWGAEVRDPFADRFGRVETYYARPRVWHCIYCGWRCVLDYDNYLCHQCKAVRPFFAPGATMVKCEKCAQWSLAIASYCEWCGEGVRRAV
jgi:hypothetical protein